MAQAVLTACFSTTLGLVVKLAADNYTPVDDINIPTGERDVGLASSFVVLMGGQMG
jgi:purine-cytosine permease-like protein